jgi:DNA-binding protein HU-beta
MTKTELIGVVAAKTSLSEREAKKAVNVFLKTIGEALEKGDRVSLLGFGSFSIIEKIARKGVNPRTRQSIIIPARKTIKFKPGIKLAECVK